MSVSVTSHGDVAEIISQLAGGARPGHLYVLAATGTAETYRFNGTLAFPLPDPPDPQVIVRLAAAAMLQFRKPGWDTSDVFAVVAYGPEYQTRPLTELIVKSIAGECPSAVLADVLRVEGGRCWSYSCPNHGECGPGGPGVPVDPLSDAAIELASELGEQP